MNQEIQILMPKIKDSVRAYCKKYQYLDYKESLSKVLFEIANKINDFDSTRNVKLSTYIHNIVNNTLNNYLRTEFRYQSKIITSEVTDNLIQDDVKGPEDVIDDEIFFEQKEKIYNLIEKIQIDSFSDFEKEIFRMHYKDSMNVVEIAAILDVERRKLTKIIEASLDKIRQSMLASAA
jgi:RNA polymerase sigma factor (sigma-70 family)